MKFHENLLSCPRVVPYGMVKLLGPFLAMFLYENVKNRALYMQNKQGQKEDIHVEQTGTKRKHEHATWKSVQSTA
jgi:hypothetical protein